MLLHNNQDPTQHTKRGSITVPYNETLTACVRCNTCVVFIGSEGPGIKIMQYLIKYMSKDIGPPVYIIPALRAANDHLQMGLNSEHRVQTDIPMARLVLQKLSNMTHRKIEVSTEMATAFCLGQSSEYMSHNFTWINMNRVMKFLANISSESDHRDLEISDDDSSQDSDMEFDDGILEAPLMITEYDCAVLAPLHVRYIHRGEDLQDLDLYSYAGIVSVKKKRAELAQEEPDHDSDFESGTNRRRRRGRRANGRYAFEDIEGLPEFEPGDIVEQQVRSLHTVPAIPGFPILSSSKEPGARARSHLRVAKHMVALFSPWTKGSPSHEMTLEGFEKLLNEAKINTPGKYDIMCNFLRLLHASKNTENAADLYRRKDACTLEEARLARNIAYENELEVREVEPHLQDALEAQQNTAVVNEERLVQQNAYCELQTRALTAALGGSTENSSEENVDLASTMTRTRSNISVINARERYAEIIQNERFATSAQSEPSAPVDRAHFNEDRPLARSNQYEEITFDRSYILREDNNSIELNQAQKQCVNQIEDLLNGKLDPERKCMFLLGGPGTGKSLVSRFIMQELGSQCIAMAPTGIAASVLHCCTIHASLCIPIGATARNFKHLSSSSLLPYQQRYETCRLIIVDEVSMISKCFFACINTRLQQIKGNEQLPYGGINMLFVGDFYQLRPVQGASLTIEDSSPGNNPIFENIFQVSYVFELKQQMRARQDTVFSDILRVLRKAPNEGLKKFIQLVKPLTSEDQEKFRNAIVIVGTNIERHKINVAMARNFARRHNCPLFAWTGDNVQGKLIDIHPEAFSVFVKGAPGVITENIAPYTMKIADGTVIEMRDLVSDDLSYDTIDGVRYLRKAPSFMQCIEKGSGVEFYAKKAQHHDKASQGNFQVKLGFAYTYHKVQGITVKNGVILDLNDKAWSKRPELASSNIQGTMPR